MTTKPGAAKTPIKTAMKRFSFNVPQPLLAQLDTLADKFGISRNDLFKTIVLASLPADPATKTPHVCPRGYRRPCDHHEPHARGPIHDDKTRRARDLKP